MFCYTGASGCGLFVDSYLVEGSLVKIEIPRALVIEAIAEALKSGESDDVLVKGFQAAIEDAKDGSLISTALTRVAERCAECIEQRMTGQLEETARPLLTSAEIWRCLREAFSDFMERHRGDIIDRLAAEFRFQMLPHSSGGPLLFQDVVEEAAQSIEFVLASGDSSTAVQQ